MRVVIHLIGKGLSINIPTGPNGKVVSVGQPLFAETALRVKARAEETIHSIRKIFRTVVGGRR